MKFLLTILTLLTIGCQRSTMKTLHAEEIQDNVCIIETVENGKNIICPSGTAFIEDETNNPSGTDLIVGVSNPCGDDPSILHDEVILITSSGQAFAYFENGNDRRLSLLSPNVTYRTTDGGNCLFSLDVNGEYTFQSVIYE